MSHTSTACHAFRHHIPVSYPYRAAIEAIYAEIRGIDNDYIKAIATYAETAINTAANPHEIVIFKKQALTAIASAKSAYNSALGELGTE